MICHYIEYTLSFQSLNVFYHIRKSFIRSKVIKQETTLETFRFILSLHIKNISKFQAYVMGYLTHNVSLKVILVLICCCHVSVFISHVLLHIFVLFLSTKCVQETIFINVFLFFFCYSQRDT